MGWMEVKKERVVRLRRNEGSFVNTEQTQFPKM
jgi:hypothetical protein